jgi:hypothetical protein
VAVLQPRAGAGCACCCGHRASHAHALSVEAPRLADMTRCGSILATLPAQAMGGRHSLGLAALHLRLVCP